MDTTTYVMMSLGLLSPSSSSSRDCSVPNLSTTRPIQKSLTRQDSQYSEDMDNLMNTKLVSSSNLANEVHSNPVTNRTVAPGFGSTQHLANSGTHGSLTTLDNYGSIAHHRTNSVIRLPHPDYTAVDMPIFPSTNAILQGKDRHIYSIFICLPYLKKCHFIHISFFTFSQQKRQHRAFACEGG